MSGWRAWCLVGVMACGDDDVTVEQRPAPELVGDAGDAEADAEPVIDAALPAKRDASAAVDAAPVAVEDAGAEADAAVDAAVVDAGRPEVTGQQFYRGFYVPLRCESCHSIHIDGSVRPTLDDGGGWNSVRNPRGGLLIEPRHPELSLLVLVFSPIERWGERERASFRQHPMPDGFVQPSPEQVQLLWDGIEQGSVF